MLVCLLVEMADGARGDLCAPKQFGDIFDTVHGYAGQVHLNKGFLDRAFTAFIALDDAGSNWMPLSFGTRNLTSPEVVPKFRS